MKRGNMDIHPNTALIDAYASVYVTCDPASGNTTDADGNTMTPVMRAGAIIARAVSVATGRNITADDAEIVALLDADG